MAVEVVNLTEKPLTIDAVGLALIDASSGRHPVVFEDTIGLNMARSSGRHETASGITLKTSTEFLMDKTNPDALLGIAHVFKGSNGCVFMKYCVYSDSVSLDLHGDDGNLTCQLVMAGAQRTIVLSPKAASHLVLFFDCPKEAALNGLYWPSPI